MSSGSLQPSLSRSLLQVNTLATEATKASDKAKPSSRLAQCSRVNSPARAWDLKRGFRPTSEWASPPRCQVLRGGDSCPGPLKVRAKALSIAGGQGVRVLPQSPCTCVGDSHGRGSLGETRRVPAGAQTLVSRTWGANPCPGAHLQRDQPPRPWVPLAHV